MRRLIVFATRLEAEATLKSLNATQTSETTFSFSQGCVLITQIGLHWAQAAVMQHASEYDEVWNFGFAGALGDHSLGEVYEVSHVGKYVPTQELLEGTHPPFHLPGNLRLITSDFPIHDLKQKEALSNQWDLVDMEGYGIAFAAHHLSLPCRMWKLVSDFASPGGRALIQKNKDVYALKIAEQINDLLIKF